MSKSVKIRGKSAVKTLTKTAPTEVPTEYIRNFASESGKIPIGKCARIGLSRVRPKSMDLSKNDEKVTTEATATSKETKKVQRSSPSPHKSFISPSCVRMGLPRMKKTPGSMNNLFTSPVLTPITPDTASLKHQTTGSASTNEKKTPARIPCLRKKVKKNLQENFDDEIQADSEMEDQTKRIDDDISMTQQDERKSKDVNDENLKENSKTEPVIQEIVQPELEHEEVPTKEELSPVKKGKALKQATKKTEPKKLKVEKIQDEAKDLVITTKRVRKRKVLSSSDEDNDSYVKKPSISKHPKTDSRKIDDTNTKFKCKILSSSSDDLPLSSISKRPTAIKQQKTNKIINVDLIEPPKLYQEFTPHKVPSLSSSGQAQQQTETSPDCPILIPQVPQSQRSATSNPKLTMRRSLSLKKRSSTSLQSQSQDFSDEDTADFVTTQHKKLKKILSSSSDSNMNSSVVKLHRVDKNPSGLSDIQKLSVSRIDSLTEDTCSQLNIELVRNEVSSLQKLIKEKTFKLETLSQSAIYKDKHKIDHLNQLTKVWEDGCKQALIELHQKLTLGSIREEPISMDALMTKLGVPEGLFTFDTSEYGFVSKV